MHVSMGTGRVLLRVACTYMLNTDADEVPQQEFVGV